jgi:glutathione S-transferase
MQVLILLSFKKINFFFFFLGSMSRSSIIKVYGYPLSQPSRAVLWTLDHLSVPHEHVCVDLSKGEQRSASYEKINALQKVPSVALTNERNETLTFSESHAIMRYFATATELYPSERSVRVHVDQALDWTVANVHRAVASLAFKVLIAPARLNKHFDKSVVDEARRDVAALLDTVERVFLRDSRRYVGGTDALSIADISLACQVDQLRALGDGGRLFDVASHPRLCAWLGRIDAVPSRRRILAMLDAVVKPMKAKL